MMMMFIFALFTTAVFAQDQCAETPHLLRDMAAIHQHLEWHAVDEKQILSAACVTKEPPEKETISGIIKKEQQTEVNDTVHGVNLKDDPKLIEHFKELTTAKDAFGWEEDPASQVNIQDVFKVNPECSSVECAVKKIWGEGVGSKILYLKLKHGYNASELAFKNSAQFKEDELDDVVMGADDLPSVLIPLGKNQRLTHFKRGSTLTMYGADNTVMANAVIMLFDLWDQQGRRSRQYTIFHEFSHNISQKLEKMDSSPLWLTLSGWVKKGDIWEAGSAACFVSEYGKSSPGEDWAESLSSYRYNGKAFKKSCPEKYDFIKDKVFKNIEYIDSYTCSELPKASVQKAHQTFKASLSKLDIKTSVTINQIAKHCGGQFSSYPASKEELDSCAFELVVNANSEPLKKILKESLFSAGLDDTQKNRAIILSGLAEDPEAKKKLASKLSGLNKTLDSFVEESLNKSLPEGLLTIKSLDMWVGSQKCAKEFFGSTMNELVNCIALNIVEEDTPLQSYGGGKFTSYEIPQIFSIDAKESLIAKRNIKLAKFTQTNESFKAETKKMLEKLKDDLRWQYKSAVKDIPNIPVTTLPSEFCQKTYGRASFNVDRYGYKDGEIVPKFQKWCESKQAASPQRFKIPLEEWTKFVNEFTSK